MSALAEGFSLSMGMQSIACLQKNEAAWKGRSEIGNGWVGAEVVTDSWQFLNYSDLDW